MSRRVLFIVNPASGQGHTAARVTDLESRVGQLELLPTIALTDHPGHATELAERASLAAPAFDAIVSVGGDGTANEVLNGLMRARDTNPRNQIPAMGVVCSGRGNDYAFGLGIPTRFTQSLELVATGRTRSVDVGRLDGIGGQPGRYFGNGMGIGFDAVVGIKADRMRRIHGFASYIIAAFDTIFKFKEAPLLRLTRDSGVETMRAILVSVMIGRRMGGAFYMTPSSLIDDGLFDICVGGEPSRLEIATLIVKLMRGMHTSNTHVTMDRSASLTVEAKDGSLVAHADGEVVCESGDRLEMSCVPGAVEVICP